MSDSDQAFVSFIRSIAAGSLLAVPRAVAGEVEVLGREVSWASVGKVKLSDLQENELVTCLDWDCKSLYIVAATNKVCSLIVFHVS